MYGFVRKLRRGFVILDAKFIIGKLAAGSLKLGGENCRCDRGQFAFKFMNRKVWHWIKPNLLTVKIFNFASAR